ncbi:PEP-CTERM sorting domain-containing protein [Rhodoferax sp.]|uniref:PEP-CTERM sorting domain-containing protein n=1 Tax=Rhodoferax sp. TaxID=50421 RepID=UPI001EC3CD03|nr:PEP-CTERM sorting domain-containing protein [Rhodoferax sp.]MBT9507744.1 PEP-CTERM sorting domain-containing protein [Rhodoferax sp.]
MKLKLIALAALLATSASSFAAMDGATSGNGSLLVNFISQGGTSATAGGDDMSAVFDLGVSMNDFLTHKNEAGYTQTWNLTSANYGSAWNDLLAFSTNDAAIEFNVIALDNVNTRYLTTNDVATYTSLTNANLGGFQNMNSYVTANNLRGTHVTEANGASTALSTDVANSYFRAVNGATQGDTWLTKTSDTTKTLATAQNFWSLSVGAGNGSAQAAKSAFGVDLDGNGSIGTGEFGEWSVNAAAGTITFANVAAVPEAETYAMLLAGLGLMGAIVRRRNGRGA